MLYNVFISYHGGKGVEAKSSYPMAERLYNYLTDKGISCFLYKKSNNVDFYDAINEAILQSQHFILVAKDRDMLSDWVKDEVKQFDSLRKNGLKANCLISALLYGSITEDDLFRFNTLFSTKDIVRDEEGIPKLYSLLYERLNAPSLLPDDHHAPFLAPPSGKNTPESISQQFLNPRLSGCLSRDEDYEYHCELLTTRLKCMSEGFSPPNAPMWWSMSSSGC